MHIPLLPDSDIPLYRQISSELERRIRDGSWESGMRLSSSRKLALELGVSRVTVESAYADLEAGGYLARRIGSGSFITECRQNLEAPCFQPLRQNEEAVHDLSSGVSDARLFPSDDFRAAIRHELVKNGIESLQYADPMGYFPFREAVARVLVARGLEVGPEKILVTSGSQEAISLAALCFRTRGKRVIVETPTYAQALDLFRSLGFAPEGVPDDDQGMDCDLLEEKLKGGDVAFLYLMPNFRNPSGTCITTARRRDIVALAAKYGVPVLEDDYVGDLRYDGHELPSLFALNPAGVVRTGTFSKLLAPGLRVGFLLAQEPVLSKVAGLKRVFSSSAPHLSQRALCGILSAGRYEAHLRKSKRIYRERRDVLLKAAREFLPECGILKPSGGLFAWLRLRDGEISSRIVQGLVGKGVLVFDGRPCFPEEDDPSAHSFIRLNFAASVPDRIVYAIGVLAKEIA